MEWATASATSGVLDTAQLRAYLTRIGLDALNDAAPPPAPDAALLRRVVAAHAERIAFEMYDITLVRAP